MRICTLATVLSLIVTLFTVNTVFAATGDTSTPAIEVVRQEAAFAEGTLDGCSGKTGDALVSCIAGSLDSLASGLEDANVKKAAPEAAKTVKDAANEVRKARGKGAIAAALKKARAKLRRLAAKSNKASAAVYRRTALVFKKALRVLNKRG